MAHWTQCLLYKHKYPILDCQYPKSLSCWRVYFFFLKTDKTWGKKFLRSPRLHGSLFVFQEKNRTPGVWSLLRPQGTSERDLSALWDQLGWKAQHLETHGPKYQQTRRNQFHRKTHLRKILSSIRPLLHHLVPVLESLWGMLQGHHRIFESTPERDSIYVARLYHHMDPGNRQGLRNLVCRGVVVQIMTEQGKNRMVLREWCWWCWDGIPEGEVQHKVRRTSSDLHSKGLMNKSPSLLGISASSSPKMNFLLGSVTPFRNK